MPKDCGTFLIGLPGAVKIKGDWYYCDGLWEQQQVGTGLVKCMGSDLLYLTLFTLLFKEASQKIEPFGLFLLSFSFYTMFHKIQRPL